MSPPIDINRFEQVRATGELPSPRGVALAIIRLTQQDEVSITELARVIAGDPAFVGRVIKAANGVIGFNRRPVVSVHEALVVLGLPAVRSMALGFSLLSDYREGGCHNFDYNHYWAHSLALALGMQIFAQRSRVAPPDEMFSLGLLVRVGELALATLYPSPYSELLAQAAEEGAKPLLEMEAAAFAMTHAELGAAMLADWGLPRVFVELVEYYERPEQSGYEQDGRAYRMLETLQAADRFAEMCVAPESARPWLLGRLLEQTEAMGFAREDVLADCVRMYTLWGEWGELLRVDMLASVPFPSLPPSEAAAHEAEVDALRDAFQADEQGNEQGPSNPASDDDEESLRVLIVDHDRSVFDLVSGLLQDEGVQTMYADTASRALDRAIEVHPRLMLIGCTAASDGSPALSLIQSLRKLKMGQPMYVLLLNDADTEESMVRAFDAGADDCVPRSAGSRVLAARLRAGLREVRMQQELERDREELRRYATALAVKNRQLEEVAMTDALTGFRNRRYAIERMTQEWAAAERDNRPMSCMVIDLDGLKEINDAHGHDVGDLVLKQIAEALRGMLRGQDVICRTGGDEFLAICPGSGLDAAIGCAERLRRSVNQLEITLPEGQLKVTISVGVAERDRTISDMDALMKLADRGAYLAKHNGRDRVAAVQRDEGNPHFGS